MKKIISLFLMLSLVLFCLTKVSFLSIKASTNSISGKVLDLSDYIVDLSLIQVDCYEISVLENSNYFINYGNTKTSYNIESDGSFNFVNNNIECNIDLSINLDTLPVGYGVLYENRRFNDDFYIDKIFDYHCEYDGKELKVTFYNSNYSVLSTNYTVNSSLDLIENNNYLINFEIIANGVTFEETFEYSKDETSAYLSEKLSDTVSSYSSSELNFVQVQQNTVKYFDESFVINNNFYAPVDMSLNNQTLNFYNNTILNIVSMYDQLGFFNQLKEEWNETIFDPIVLELNLYIREDDQFYSSDSSYSNHTIICNVSNDISNITNQSIIIHEFSHFIEAYLSDYYILSGSVFDEGFATFMEYYYLSDFTNALYDIEFSSASQQNEINRLKTFTYGYGELFTLFMEDYSKKKLGVMSDNILMPNILLPSGGIQHYSSYWSFSIFISIFDIFEGNEEYFGYLYDFLLNYQSYREDSLDADYESEQLQSLYQQDFLFKLFVESFDLEINIVIDKLFELYFGTEEFGQLFDKKNSFTLYGNYSKNNVIITPNDSIYIPISTLNLSYFWSSFSEYVDISIYNYNHEVEFSERIKFIEFFDILETDGDYIIKIENNNNFEINFDFVYYNMKKINESFGSEFIESNEINHATKLFLSNEAQALYSFKLTIENSENEVDLSQIMTVYNIIENKYENLLSITQTQDNIDEAYLLLSDKSNYILTLNLTGVDLNDTSQNDIILKFNCIEDYKAIVDDENLIFEITNNNLNNFTKLEYYTYGNYALVFQILNREGIANNFYVNYVVLSKNGTLKTYDSYISSDNISCINYIDIYKGDVVYVIYPTNSFASGILIETYLCYSQENMIPIIPDKEGSPTTLMGTEVKLNGGSCESNIITTGFSRCMFLEQNDVSIIRQQYYWFSTNEEVITISEFGTALGKKAGYARVYAVYKYDFSIVGCILMQVVNETNSNEVRVKYGLDVRTNGDVSGTDVDVNNVETLNVDDYSNIVVEINEGFTRYICLGDDSPSQQLQHFIWETNSSNVYVSEFGTIFGITSSSEELLITGIYRYNERFKVYIRIRVI